GVDQVYATPPEEPMEHLRDVFGGAPLHPVLELPCLSAAEVAEGVRGKLAGRKSWLQAYGEAHGELEDFVQGREDDFFLDHQPGSPAGDIVLMSPASGPSPAQGEGQGQGRGQGGMEVTREAEEIE
ncbi:unnamed protein product, partial [Discosporangium mesarthrocarpum]